MQFYLPGVTPTFWREVESLPTGVYKKEYDQTPSTPVNQLFVSFLNRPVGTIVGIFINDSLVATSQVIDDSGMIYARISLPHTYGQDDIEVYVKDMFMGVVVERSSFSTSNIDLMFEVQAKMFDQQWADSQQIEEDVTIEGVEGSLLESKFGVFTGLSRRNDQTELQYRNQTSCLWKAFRYSSMEKGLVDSLRCLLGQNISVVVSKSKDAYANEVFDVQQFIGDSVGNEGYFPPSVNLVRASWKNPPVNDIPDKPHFYIHDRPDDFYLPPTPAGNRGIDIILNGNDVYPVRRSEPWDTDIARSFTINSNQAIGNEVIVDINELDAMVSVIDEGMHRQDSLIDQMVDRNVASISITSATTGSGLLPVEDVDFVLNRLEGIITWLYPYGLTTQTPETNTTYTVSYSFRLDDAIRTVVKQIKPAQKSVVIKFNVNTMIPWYSQYFDSLNLGDLNAQDGWVRTSGGALSIAVTNVNPIQGSKSALMKQEAGFVFYSRDLGSLQTNYDIFWDWEFTSIGPTTEYMTMMGMTSAFGGLQWSVSADGNGNIYLDHLGASYPGTLIGTFDPSVVSRFRVRVTPDEVVRVYVGNSFLAAQYVKSPATGTRWLKLQMGIGSEQALLDEITSVYYTASPSRLPLAIEV